MWKFWLVGFLVIGAAFAMDFADNLFNPYRAGLALFCCVMAVVTWRQSHAANDETLWDLDG